MDNIEKIDLNSVDWQSSREFFDSLKDELEKLDDHNESYDFTWVGKRKSIIEAGAPINKTLRPDIEASKNFDNTSNILVVGDNLDALKILQESYLGQVKMIYIDPPYNTGHDFVYHDNFATNKANYVDSNTSEDDENLVDEDPMKLNAASNGRFHSDWLSMIYPRLKLARNLLSDDGVIFISIDDNEQANLKKVCDEIFGEENFENSIHWRRRSNQPNDDSKMIATVAESIMVYAKKIDILKTCHAFGKMPLSLERLKAYTNPDNDPKGPWSSTPWCASKGQGGSRYKITTPTGVVYDETWLGNEETFLRNLQEGRMFFPNNGNGKPRKKIWAFERSNDGQPAINFWYGREYGDNLSATNDFGELFESDTRIFDYTKPVKLIKNFIRLGSPKVVDSNSLILDFFAGSGTTGHAVMDLNAEDGGNRRYILVQLPEETNEKSEARKAGYETIDQITAERLRRAGEKVQKEHPDAKVDTGFRVFRIDDSNEKENIRKPLEEYTQETMLDMVDNLKPDRTPLDLLFGAVYASALPFDLQLETRKIGDNTVYLYGYLGESSGLVACFDDNISDDTVKEIAKLKPLAAVFKDSSFADSAAKINLSEHFRILSVDTKVKVI